MRRRSRDWHWLLLLLFALSPAPSVAVERLPDVRLLIDISGSMRDSDPSNLREPALELMLRLLPDGAKAGVWTFGQQVNMPVPHALVDAAWREQASAAVSEIGNHGLLTNIPAALRAASWDIDQLDYNYQTSIILLTDGKVEVSDGREENAAAALQILERTAVEFRQAGVAVHTIALSADADEPFLKRLAQETGGLSEQVFSAEQLSAVFLQALDIASPTEQVPIYGGGFLIDGSVREFTALIFREPDVERVVLTDPAGTRFSADSDDPNLNWFHHPRFELITVTAPLAGDWLIAAPGAIARVNILSGLSLQVDAPPTSMPEGRVPEIGISLLDDGRPVDDAALLGVVDFSVQVARNDGERWELSAAGEEIGAGGEVRVALPMLAEAGRYQIRVLADGGSFQREVSAITDVFAPPPQMLAPVAEPDNFLARPGWMVPGIISLVLLLLVAVFARPGRRR